MVNQIYSIFGIQRIGEAGIDVAVAETPGLDTGDLITEVFEVASSSANIEVLAEIGNALEAKTV